MAGDDDQSIAISDGNDIRHLFPGYYPPTKEDRQQVYREGLVSLDANALLDLYRFSQQARDEFLEVLGKLHLRLFVTHQAALEFYRNRLGVVEARLNAAEEKCKEIEQPLKNVVEKINEFTNRYQIDTDEKTRLISLVNGLGSALSDSIKAAGAYDLTRDEVRAGTDTVVKRLEVLLKGRVGSPLDEIAYKKALAEAAKRREDRVPPGYAEKKAAPERQAGDYLVWRQLMNEAALHGKPVLLICDEQKEDWVLTGSSGQILGPRPELVLEMQREAKVQFHMVSVVGLLKEAAPEFLDTTVSESTIREAESIPTKQLVGIEFSTKAAQAYQDLTRDDQIRFAKSFTEVYQKLADSKTLGDLDGTGLKRLSKGSFLLRWSALGRAIFRVKYDASDEYEILVVVTGISEKKHSDPGPTEL